MNKIFAVLGVIILLLLVIIFIPHNTVSNTAINTYLITLKNVPEGKGMYQQLININLSYPYGINSNGSNILFKDGSNNTFLYAWIQSINATNLQVWIKNYNNSILIEMMILPQYENLFSNTGYLGEAPQLSLNYAEYDNGLKVFPLYYNFINTIEVSGWVGENYIINDGLSWSVNNTTRFYITSQIFTYNQNSTITDFYFKSSLPETNLFINGMNSEINDWESNIVNNSLVPFVHGGDYGIGSLRIIKPVNVINGQILGINLGVGRFFVDNQNFSYINAGLSGNEFQWYFSGNGGNGYVPYVFTSDVGNNDAMPTFTISPIGTAPNPLYLSNSFTISNILLMDEKVKL